MLVALAWWLFCLFFCVFYTVYMLLWVKLWTRWLCCRSRSAWFCIIGVQVIPLDLLKKMGNTFTTGGYLMVLLRWGKHLQQVGIWRYSGGHLVVFRWGFGGIKVGNTFTIGVHLVVFRWGKMRAIFRNGQHQRALIKIPHWPQLG